MSLLPSQNQIPDHSILDINGKQTYLGNQYICSVLPFITTQSETPIILLQNPTTLVANPKSIFQNVKKLTCLSASLYAYFKFYFNPTLNTYGIQTVKFRADSGGNLNNTYFLLYDAQGNEYYVWFNINSAGTDPMVPGATGIQITGATGASATTLGGAAATAIQAVNSGGSFTASNSSGTVTITNVVGGTFKVAVDSVAAPTSFTFQVTGGLGNKFTPINLRPASQLTSIANCYTIGNFGVSSNGTYLANLASSNFVPDVSSVIEILDPGQTLLVTVQTNESSGINIAAELLWYEI
jgi:hypothetical protein